MQHMHGQTSTLSLVDNRASSHDSPNIVISEFAALVPSSFTNTNMANSGAPNSGNYIGMGENSANLQAPLYRTVAYSVPPVPPQGSGIPYGPLPASNFDNAPQHMAYPQLNHATYIYEKPQPSVFRPQQPVDVTSNRPTAEPYVGPENVREQVVNVLREQFGVEPKGRSRVYQRPYPDFYDNVQYPKGFRVSEFIKFTGDDSRTTLEHVG